MKHATAKHVAFPGASYVTPPTPASTLVDPNLVATIVATVMAVMQQMGGVTRPLVTAAAASQPGQSQMDPALTLVDAINAFIVAKCRAEKSDRYLRQVRGVLSSFAKSRIRKPLQALTNDDVETWLLGSDWSPRTMRGALSDLKTFLNYCVRRGWVTEEFRTQITFVELPPDKARLKPIVIHTPAEVKKILETARALDLDVMKKLAIRYFAGVRTAESHRMGDENILKHHVEVTRAAAKGTIEKKRRRLIKIQPCLRAWLDLGGVLRPMNDQTVRKVTRASGVPWHDNVTRHTWESYRVASSENKAATAKESGHSVAIQGEHYDAVALPEEAKKFYAIFPDPEPWEVAIPSHGGVRAIVRSDDKRKLNERHPESGRKRR